MKDNLEYIDDYFQGKPLTAEIKEFEQRVISDPAFAEDVAFYLSAKKALKEKQEESKKKRFREIYRTDRPNQGRAIMRPLRKIWGYAAAAAVLGVIALGWYLYNPGSEQQLADDYIKSNLQLLSVKMSPTEDSLQKGSRLFNEGRLSEAQAIFEEISKSDPSSLTAKKYAGIASLRLGDYDKALRYFENLANHKDVFSNPGLFYQALTLLKRNDEGDQERATQLLKQVVANDLEGKETADEWLKK